ncbi:MAG: heavy metal-binding domain-containing protein [Bacteroidota bacterium]
MKNNYFPILSLLFFLIACQSNEATYVCPPCDMDCDKLTFDKAGKCPHCNMTLVLQEDLLAEQALLINEIHVEEGSGSFLIEGGVGQTEKSIQVYYHRPKNYRANANVLMVIPGAGRNGDRYRDAWIEESEKYGVLILSPKYREQDYDFGAYHLCNLMYDLNLEGSIEYVEGTNHAKMEEVDFTYQVNDESTTWLFQDFDRIFDLVVDELDMKTQQYDLFGHSAGGQILHRLAIFYDSPKINRIVAANSGFYTLPDLESDLPFGIKNTILETQDLQAAFRKKMLLFIGELDNAEETGGTLLRSASADQQGLHRLARGQYFYQQSQTTAKELEADFNWQIQIIPEVGHDHEKMGDAAAKYLYENEQ